MDEATRHPRVLFVVSNQFGELSIAASCAAGITAHSLLLVPERLGAGLRPESSFEWRTVKRHDDIIHAAQEYQPDVVILASGYLLIVDGLVPMSSFCEFVDALSRVSTRVATTDPFLGLHQPTQRASLAEWLPHRESLRAAFATTATCLQRLPHVYYTHASRSLHAKGVAVFNPGFAAHGTKDTSWSDRFAQSIDESRQRWLFILSRADFDCLAGAYGQGYRGWLGKDRLVALVGNHIRDALANGRQPILLAPRECAQALSDFAHEGAVVETFCGLSDFVRLLADAEHVFYWNVFSHSLIDRLALNKPVHFFDHGHMVAGLPAMLGRGLQYFYCTNDVPLLSPYEPLAVTSLAAAARQQVGLFAEARKQLAASASPQALLDTFLADSGLFDAPASRAE